MMRSIKQNISAVILGVLATVALLSLSGCGADATTAAAAAAAVTTTASTISLSTTGTSVKSDGTNSVTITATVLTSGNSILAAQALTFTASSGQLSAATATTDATGKATFTFSAGTSGLNRTATITVTASGSTITASIPIQIIGSTLALTTNGTSFSTGVAVPITATAKDGGANLMANQSLRYSIAATSTGSGTLSVATGTTNTSGAASVSLTGTAAGNVDVLVEWLDAAGAVTASATKSIAITAAGSSFSVTTPASSPFAVSIGTNQAVVVNVPTSIGTPAVTVAKIRYATTLGSWAQVGTQALCNTALQKVCTVTWTSTTDTQSFVPGANAGNATVQIDALNAAGAVISTATLTFSITSPASNASKITLQSNSTVIPPSTGTTSSNATLTATVYDASNNKVGNAAVLFELVNSTGSGESITPVITMTNTGTVAGFPAGEAQAVYTAGTSTTQNNQVRASIVGLATAASSAVQGIVVGGTAGSIAIGVSTTITTINSNTQYQLPVSLLVTDSTGAAVSGAVVSLSLWPTTYYKGTRTAACVATYAGPAAGFANEDKNQNLVLDAGEDVDGPGGYALGGTFLGPVDGILWPPLAAAGSIPTSVTTDATGQATFNWIYLKQYANWVTARITATTKVQGSQSTASLPVSLIPAASDVATPCSLPASPFN